MAAQAVCPIVGTTTNVLPPHHPEIPHDSEARCPITNAKVEHHPENIISNHSSDINEPESDNKAMDASKCPALKGAASSNSVTDALCPVVGPVNAHLPPSHPALNEKESGAVCPVTNATLDHHKTKVLQHKAVANDASALQCPVISANKA